MAGGGKSASVLMKNLDGIHDKNFRCSILRRYEPELKKLGGLIDESKNVYSFFTKEPYKTQNKQWIFPSGAMIAFGAISCDDDLRSWQGSQLTRICVDEVCTGWTEKQILFLQSRLRTVGSDIHPQLLLTGNPEFSSFMKEWVDFCLDPDTGVPVSGTENRIRWFYVEDNKAKWADSPEECYELYGKPKGMIYAHKMSEDEMNKLSVHDRTRLFMPKSFRFIPTGVFDNKYLLPPLNNSYLPSLLSQPYVNQLVFLHGSWTAREQGSSFFDRSWVEIVDFAPPDAVRARAWDFASEEKTKSNNPDFTAGVKMSRDKLGFYYIEDVVRFQASVDKVLKKVAEIAEDDGDKTTTIIPTDPAAAGKAASFFFKKVLAEAGIYVKTAPTVSGKSKLTRFLPFCSLAESGFVKVVRGDWNEEYFCELERFSADLRIQKHSKDDQLDATSDVFNYLVRNQDVPNFSLPNLTQPSPIPTL
jgi:predicted phage terminase large subunit-like protein